MKLRKKRIRPEKTKMPQKAKKQKKPKKPSSFWKNVLYVFQGLLVGMGAVVPGAIGGVLGVAFGYYEPIMELLTHPKQALKKHYKRFIPFVIGWLTSFVLLAKAIEVLFATDTSITLMLFFGLICGTLPELIKTSEKSDPQKSWTPMIISLSVSYFVFYLLEGGGGVTVPTSFWSYLLCGVLWGLSLIVPGLASSGIMIYLGLYEPMNVGIGSLDFSVIIPLLLGVAISVSVFARFVNMLFKKHYAIISRVILGFVTASTLMILPKSFANLTIAVVSFVCFIAGFVLTRMMDIIGKKQEKRAEEQTQQYETVTIIYSKKSEP